MFFFSKTAPPCKFFAGDRCGFFGVFAVLPVFDVFLFWFFAPKKSNPNLKKPSQFFFPPLELSPILFSYDNFVTRVFAWPSGVSPPFF